jgi:hypothetical protein
MFADHLGIRDVNALACTCRAVYSLLTPYMYRRAKRLRTRFGRPYFLRAVDFGNLTAVQRFIEAGTSVDIRDTMVRTHLATSLHSCVDTRDIATAKLLIQNGVELSPFDNHGWTPLHYAVGRPNPNERMARLLLDAGADIFAPHPESRSVLYTAAMYGTASIVQLLLERGAAAATITTPDEPTPLHAAATHRSAATVQRLLQAGLEIDRTDDLGNTPLHDAVTSGRADNVQTLLNWGANIEATNHYGHTPLHGAIITVEREAAAHRVLHRAVVPHVSRWKGSESCVPVCRFAQCNEPIINQLLDAGADIMATINGRGSPLDWAIFHVGRA